MILAVMNEDQNKNTLLKYSAMSAGLTATLQTIGYTRDYFKQKDIPKDVFLKSASKNIAKNSVKCALITALLCEGFSLFNKYLNKKSQMKNTENI